MDTVILRSSCSWVWTAIWILTASIALGQGDDRFIGTWALDRDFEVVELTFRSNGRYELHTMSTEVGGYHLVDRGRYQVTGQEVTLTLDEVPGKSREPSL